MMEFLEAELVEKLPGGGERPKFPTIAAYLAHHYPTEAAWLDWSGHAGLGGQIPGFHTGQG